MQKLALIILISLTSLCHAYAQYIYEEFPMMWQPIDQLADSLKLEGYDLVLNEEDEDCKYFSFKRENQRMIMNCCNADRDSVTNMKFILDSFKVLLNFQDQLNSSQDISRLDSFICSYPTSIFSDELDYEAVLVFNSEKRIYTCDINYFSDFEYINENYERIFKCDSKPNFFKAFIDLLELKNSNGHTIQSYFDTIEPIPYLSFEDCAKEVVEFRNSDKFQNTLLEFNENFKNDELYQKGRRKALVALELLAARRTFSEKEGEQIIVQNLIQKGNYIGIILLEQILN